MGIEDDSAGPGPAENFRGETGIGAADFDRFDFGVAFGLDLDLHGHTEEVEILLHSPIDAQTGLRSIDSVGRVAFRSSGGADPLRENRSHVGLRRLFGIRRLGAGSRRVSSSEVGRLWPSLCDVT